MIKQQIQKKNQEEKLTEKEKKKETKIKTIGFALREAKNALRQLIFFNTLMDIIVFFALCLLGAKLLSLGFWYSLIPLPIYIYFHTKGNIKDINFKTIENKVPILYEELSTSADNWRKNNEVVNSLNEDVIQKMKNVKTSYFINFGKIFRQLMVLLVVSFILIGSSALNIKFFDIKNTVKELREFNPAKQYTINEELLAIEEGLDLSNILGEEEILELGTRQLNLEINPGKTDVDISKVNEATQRTFNTRTPSRITASSEQSFGDTIPTQYHKVVKNYFSGITK